MQVELLEWNFWHVMVAQDHNMSEDENDNNVDSDTTLT